MDGFSVKAWWETNHAGKEDLVFLLAYPEGEQRGGGMSFAPDEHPAGYGDGAVHLNPLGIFIHNERAVAPQGEKCWVYLPYGGAYGNGRFGGGVRPISQTSESEMELRIADYENLEKTPLWKERIYPVLVQESLNFCEEFKKKRGAYPPSRFLKAPAVPKGERELRPASTLGTEP
ncbi:MAG: hypothetical protein ACR2FY_02945 [Pirellulaceae bacterium]